jgi:hypothetical protein
MTVKLYFRWIEEAAQTEMTGPLLAPRNRMGNLSFIEVQFGVNSAIHLEKGENQ